MERRSWYASRALNREVDEQSKVRSSAAVWGPRRRRASRMICNSIDTAGERRGRIDRASRQAHAATTTEMSGARLWENAAGRADASAPTDV